MTTNGTQQNVECSEACGGNSRIGQTLLKKRLRLTCRRSRAACSTRNQHNVPQMRCSPWPHCGRSPALSSDHRSQPRRSRELRVGQFCAPVGWSQLCTQEQWHPSATISNRRLSKASGRAKSLAPTSRQTPVVATRSSGRPHRQLRSEKESATKRTGNITGQILNGAVGAQKKGKPAIGPPWERNKVLESKEKRGQPLTKQSSSVCAAPHCHLCFFAPGLTSSKSFCLGCAPLCKSAQG